MDKTQIYQAPFRVCAYHGKPISITSVVYDITKAFCTTCAEGRLKVKKLNCPKCQSELDTTYTDDGFIAQCKGEGDPKTFNCNVYYIEHHNGYITLSTTKAKGKGPYAKETPK